jgi:ABC-type enterochelin transport system substrate-binding protein
MQQAVVERAKSSIAIQKLVPLGHYLDMAESTRDLPHNPTRYQALSVAALDIIKRFHSDEQVRETCKDSNALLELLENVDFEAARDAGTLNQFKFTPRAA